jgi:hypothetical protein
MGVAAMIDWLRARPWRIWPHAKDGWHYRAIYRDNRRGAWHPTQNRWIRNAEPVGRLRALWRAISFPHEHYHRGGRDG